MESNSLPRQISRFSIAGVINSAIGYIVIFGGMVLGFSPYLSNLAGYVAGFFCSFFLSRNFVFFSAGKNRRKIARFFLTFVMSYLANAGVLHLCLRLGINVVASQIVAGISYLLIMFSLSRLWVFK